MFMVVYGLLLAYSMYNPNFFVMWCVRDGDVEKSGVLVLSDSRCKKIFKNKYWKKQKKRKETA